MASAHGRESAALIERLFSESYRFDFFQAVRLLLRLAKEQPESGDSQPKFPVGEDFPNEEAVEFRGLLSQSFASSAVSKIHPPKSVDDFEDRKGPAEMVVAFMGMFGPQGALPQHYTALLLERAREKDQALRSFLDMFNHRAISLFFRAWQKYRLPFNYERSLIADGTESDEVTHSLYSMVGLGTGGLRNRLPFSDEAVLFYGGHFGHFPRSSIALEAILRDYFGLPIDVLQAQENWLILEESDLSALHGKNNRMGAGFVVGERVLDRQNKFRIRLGPLSYDDFSRFLPGSEGLKVISHWARFYAGAEFDFDVQVVLAAPDVPDCSFQTAESKTKLGWTSWMRRKPFTRDVDDAIFTMDI